MEGVVGITGGGGFIGNHLVDKLERSGHKVIVPFGRDEDIKSYQSVFNFITKNEVDYIFHLAAQTIVGTAYHNPLETLNTNVVGTFNILEAVRHYPKIKGVLIASSDKAYGKSKGTYKEDDPLKGDHPYDVSKSCADLIANAYHKTYNLPVVTTRFGNVYGGGDWHFNRIIPGIFKAIINDEILEIRSDGTFTRDYIYVKDVVNASISLMENIDKVKGEAFNISSNNNFSVIDLIKKMEKVLGKKVKYEILNTAKNEITHQSLSCKKIKKAIGWEAKWSFEDAIIKSHEIYSDLWKGL